MSNTTVFLISLLGVVILVAVAVMLPGGCSGNCEQGRKPCDCDRGKWEK